MTAEVENLLIVLFPVFLLLGILVLLGYELVPQVEKIAAARVWRDKRRAADAEAKARKVQS